MVLPTTKRKVLTWIQDAFQSILIEIELYVKMELFITLVPHMVAASHLRLLSL